MEPGGPAGGHQRQKAPSQAATSGAGGANNPSNLSCWQQQQHQMSSRACAPAGLSAGPARQSFVRDEADVVFNRLMALEGFRKLHPSLIRNLCSNASIERIDKGVLGE